MQPCTICNGFGTDEQGRVCPYADVHKAKRPSMHNIRSPRSDDDAVETEIKAKGLTAPRVTPDDVASSIVSEHYFTGAEGSQGALIAEIRAFAPHKAISTAPLAETCVVSGPLDLLTFCVLVLKNGFTVTGESACASPENFDAEVGKKIARANAANKIWPLMGYLLKEHLYRAPPAQAELPL